MVSCVRSRAKTGKQHHGYQHHMHSINGFFVAAAISSTVTARVRRNVLTNLTADAVCCVLTVDKLTTCGNGSRTTENKLNHSSNCSYIIAPRTPFPAPAPPSSTPAHQHRTGRAMRGVRCLEL